MMDFLGNEVQVGDKVICTEIDYANLVEAVIVSIAPKTILVEHQAGWTKEEYLVRHRKSRCQFIKINNPEL